MTRAGKGRGESAEIESTVTYLEMRQRPAHAPPPVPAGKIALLRAENPTVSFYRYLFNTVGERWLWWKRRVMSDDELLDIISDPDVEIHTLFVNGVPAGFSELDFRQPGNVELAYFGLIPDFIGRGFGGYLLHWTVERAWSRNPDRVWVHTCTEDHPAALGTYQRAGFEVYDRETETVRVPIALAVLNDNQSV